MKNPSLPKRGHTKSSCWLAIAMPACSCGLSKQQPFCDGSHTSTKSGMKPVVWTQQKDQSVFLCGCKYSGKVPYCDGSHNSL